MKNWMARMLSLFGLAVLVVASTNLAQSATILVVEIPFAFDVGTAHFDAGNYLINEYVPGRGILEVRRTDGSGTAFVMASSFENNPATGSKSRLLFNKYADQYFLSQVWMEDGTLNCKLTPSKKEKEAMNIVAANNNSHEVVQIAAR
jgi:hypothetical protein